MSAISKTDALAALNNMQSILQMPNGENPRTVLRSYITESDARIMELVAALELELAENEKLGPGTGDHQFKMFCVKQVSRIQAVLAGNGGAK
jgi:hypothetical protein